MSLLLSTSTTKQRTCRELGMVSVIPDRTIVLTKIVAGTVAAIVMYQGMTLAM